MKSFLRLSLMALAIAFIFGSLSVTETKAQLQEILNRMDANNKSLQSLRANAMMVKYDSLLKESESREGKTIYLPSKAREPFVRIDWTKPEETLATSNGVYVLYRPRLGQAITGKTKEAKGSGKAGGALSFINMSKAQLKANYSIQYIGAEKLSNGTETVHLQLTPKAVTSYKMAEVWVDKDGMPVQAKVIETNNDWTTILLSNIQKNITINAKEFKVSLPPKTDIIPG